MTEQEHLMRQISANQFAMWELHIFLDTHPGDCAAAAKLEEYRKTADTLTAKYEAAYGPIHETTNTANRWAWIASPWPWEIGEGDK
jgi:spore coat protein JB